MIKRAICFPFVVALLWSFSLSIQADVYKWVDENGRVHYSNENRRVEQVEGAEKVRIDVKSLTVEQQEEADEKRKYYSQLQQERREERATRNSNRRKNGNNYRAGNCRYYKEKLANARQKQKDLKLSGYTMSQKEHLQDRVREAQARIKQHCK